MATVYEIDLPGINVADRTILETVLSNYPPPLRAAGWTPLGAAGGFSGGHIWRGTRPDGRTFALKAFPVGFDAHRLEQVHRWLSTARAAGLDFIPDVARCEHGRTVATCDGRCWEITTWMPGTADFHADPSDSRLRAAVTAVARIHDAWQAEAQYAPCPAVLRRFQALGEWEDRVRSGWRPRFETLDPVAPFAEAAWHLLPAAVAGARHSMLPWLDRTVPVQPSIGDVWHDHVLFQRDRVTGIIDFAAAKMDHVAADLARLLGSLVGGDLSRMQTAIKAYSVVRPVPETELIPILDRGGVVASTANWLRRLYFDNERVADRAAVAARLAELVKRLL